MSRLIIRITFLILVCVPSVVWGQYTQQNRVSSFSAAFRSTSSAILSRPTVSPYLALTDLTGSGTVDTSRNYFTQVRPRLDDINQQRRTQQALINIQQNVSSLRSAAIRQGQGRAIATGHPTRFMTYSHYFPGLMRR